MTIETIEIPCLKCGGEVIRFTSFANISEAWTTKFFCRKCNDITLEMKPLYEKEAERLQEKRLEEARKHLGNPIGKPGD